MWTRIYFAVAVILSCTSQMNGCGNLVADVVLLVDTSGSISAREWQEQIHFIRTIVNNFTIGPDDVQISIVTFSDVVQNEFYLDDFTRKAGVLQGIDAIRERTGTTHTSEGLEYVRTNSFNVANGDRPNAPNILIVITDGRATVGHEPQIEAELLRQAGVWVVAIGVGSLRDISELEAMASDQDHVFEVNDFTSLPTILVDVQIITCGVDGGWSAWDIWDGCSQTCGNGIQYRDRACTNPPPTAPGLPCQGPARDERRCFTPCPTTQIPTAPNTLEYCNTSVADIVFLIDTSGSIQTEHWLQQLEFVHRMVQGFTIGPNDIQVGAVTFSDTVNNEFDLNSHSTKQDLLIAINRILERSGYTHTSEGLRYVRTQAFTNAQGDRPYAHNVLIVITDGVPTLPYDPTAEARLLQQAGVTIIAIGVESGAGRSELEVMATSSRHVFSVTDFTALLAIQNEVMTVTCDINGNWSPWGNWSDCSQTCEYGIQYRERTCTNPIPSANGAPCAGPDREARMCFTPCPTSAPTEGCENVVADIVLLVDTSTSISVNEWAEQIQFIQNLVTNFTIGPNNIQLGIVTFSTRIQTEFYLNTYTDNQGVLAGIAGIRERSGSTYTSEGLEFVRRNAFNVTHGDRPNAPNVLVVITDGRATAGHQPHREARLLKQAGVKIIAIGVGRLSYAYELQIMASNQNHTFQVMDFADLPTILSDVQTVTCADSGRPSVPQQ